MLKKCPLCQKDMSKEFFPFCSERCQQVDLGKWFNESYVVSSPIETDQLEREDESE